MLEIHVLGFLRLRIDGQDVRFSGRILRRLLLRLLLADGRAVSGDELAEAGWGHVVSKEAVRVQLHRVRSALEPSGVQVTATPNGWSLHLGGVAQDRHRFDALVTGNAAGTNRLFSNSDLAACCRYSPRNVWP